MNTAAIRAETPPYSEPPPAKRERLLAEMNDLIALHANNCVEYRRILDVIYQGRRQFESLEDLPFLPVRLFKELTLSSILPDQIFKTLRSSGTTGQRTSLVILDKLTAAAQTRALVRIVTSYLGPKRLPLLIVDQAAVLQERNAFSARGAGILGFSQFGTDHTYALKNETMEPDWAVLEAFLARHQNQRIFLFGFTSIIWQHLLRRAEESGLRFDFGQGVLIHGGGWKKLEMQSISNDEFKARLHERFGIRAVFNYYGMVEQTGSIYMECEAGYLHASDYSEVIVRDPRSLRPCATGQAGLIETFSSIPRSYPGHALLTEDLGFIQGQDGCECGRRGTYFVASGRLASAELRGCSDTYGRS